jgi:hypothetical protein
MDDIDHDRALAALEQLEAEKERRLQEKIDSGEIVSVQTTVVVGARDENTEDACQRHLANLPTSTPDGRPIHYDPLVIVTGVPGWSRVPGQWVPPQVQTASSKGPLSAPDEVEAPTVPPISRSEPTYVRIIIRNGEDGDPGQIAEAYYTIEDGLLVLRDSNDKHITSRALLNGEDPAVLARILLRESEAPKDFQRPLHYPKMGLA